MTMHITFDKIVSQLVSQFPELHPIYDVYLKEQHGENLAHIFFIDLTIYIQNLSNQPDKLENLRAIATFLEEAMNSPDELVQELIVVSFIENLERDDPGFNTITSMFGPALQKALYVYDNWKPDPQAWEKWVKKHPDASAEERQIAERILRRDEAEKT